MQRSLLVPYRRKASLEDVKAKKSHYVLMIDDDESLVGIMSIRLKQAGYQVDTALRAIDGYALAAQNSYDVLILDVTMPDMNGYEVCKKLRANGIQTPILMLSGKTEEASIIRSLELGADDYMTKPFSHVELLARLRALVRRSNRTFAARTLERQGISLDIAASAVHTDSKVMRLTQKEALLLQKLMEASPSLVSREQLLSDVWGIDDTHTSNRLDVYVRRLRERLKKIEMGHLVHTHRGSGYYFADIKKDAAE